MHRRPSAFEIANKTEADHPHPFFGGVEVTPNGRAIADLSCKREKTQAPWGGLLETKRALGLMVPANGTGSTNRVRTATLLTHHLAGLFDDYPKPIRLPIVPVEKWGEDPKPRNKDRICGAHFAEMLIHR